MPKVISPTTQLLLKLVYLLTTVPQVTCPTNQLLLSCLLTTVYNVTYLAHLLLFTCLLIVSKVISPTTCYCSPSDHSVQSHLPTHHLLIIL